jgi:hypothetical protein
VGFFATFDLDLDFDLDFDFDFDFGFDLHFDFGFFAFGLNIFDTLATAGAGVGRDVGCIVGDFRMLYFHRMR